ncbi:MAG: ATP-dependent sacrificial sulfur transferase LarE, partial [Planctomycetota bacterium]
MLFAERVALLERRLKELPPLLVALSGGVDSAALLGSAARVLPGRVLAATTSSPAVPDEDVRAAVAVARHLGVPHRVVATQEMSDPAYTANDGERCYFCRREMYGALEKLAAAEGLAAIADGLQAEDDADDRPGVRAAVEQGVLHPLREAGFRKRELRRLARSFGLALHDKPAQPCLASRLPVGVEVTLE